MEGAGEGSLIATFLAAQCRSTVRAGIEDSLELVILGAGNDHRLAAYSYGEIVAQFGDLALVSQVNPVTFEDIFHLQFE